MARLNFTPDGMGWCDLKVAEGPDNFVSISVAYAGADAGHFILVSEGDDVAAFHLSRKKLRKIAKAILRETKE
jgi:hypothetical protein